jgi:hypothetical protein
VAASARIKDFLNMLADDPAKEAEFDDHAERMMTDFGLNADQQNLVLHGTLKKIRKAIKKETSSGFEIFMIKMK